MRTIGFGLIGTGFMGKCHTLAYRSVRAVLDTVLTPRLVRVCDRDRAAAESYAERSGFERASDDWREVVEDPDVDIVAITTPDKFHCEMALAALAAGKHVHCEKPLAFDAGRGRAHGRGRGKGRRKDHRGLQLHLQPVVPACPEPGPFGGHRGVRCSFAASSTRISWPTRRCRGRGARRRPSPVSACSET